ncbi:10519_t:CDS:2 [Funneliformis caledonium]|uniref:10519_t:CDS:1 n=1 Tax=Funneliformis caledonium TaxID=1117310 RepID=A0A9N9DKE6_9GLOM|nr:10519_t:CDS:2 [Funneliformis caledonium]
MSKIFLSLNNDNVFSGIIPNETYWYNEISNFQPRRLDTTYLEWAVLLLGWYIILSSVPSLWIDYDLWNAFVKRDTISQPLRVIKTGQQKALDTTSFPQMIPHTELLDSGSQRTVISNTKYGNSDQIFGKQNEDSHSTKSERKRRISCHSKITIHTVQKSNNPGIRSHQQEGDKMRKDDELYFFVGDAASNTELGAENH